MVRRNEKYETVHFLAVSYDFFRRIEHFQSTLTPLNACIITDDALKHNNLPSFQTKMNRPKTIYKHSRNAEIKNWRKMME
jgi:hypothetical protein